jgi:hypothetical protein
VDAQLRYYNRMPQSEVDALSDEKWAELFADLEWIRKKEAEKEGGG